MPRRGYGKKDGSQKGLESGGMRRNEISICRHPSLKKKRSEK